MKLNSAMQLSLVLSLAISTACSAGPLSKKNADGATSAGKTVFVTPELQQADDRVKQAQGQLDLAKKQLSAAKSILKAAEADLKAAKAEREALALRTQAQDLASEAGMTPNNNRSLAQAEINKQPTAQPPISTAAPAAMVNPTPAVRTEQMEFSVQPPPARANASPDSVTPELR